MADSVQTTLTSISETSSTINRVARQLEEARVGDAISGSIALLPQLFSEAQVTLQQTQRTLKGIETFSNSLEGIGKDFEGIGSSVKEQLQMRTERLRTLLRSPSRSKRTVNNSSNERPTYWRTSTSSPQT